MIFIRNLPAVMMLSAITTCSFAMESREQKSYVYKGMSPERAVQRATNPLRSMQYHLGGGALEELKTKIQQMPTNEVAESNWTQALRKKGQPRIQIGLDDYFTTTLEKEATASGLKNYIRSQIGKEVLGGIEITIFHAVTGQQYSDSDLIPEDDINVSFDPLGIYPTHFQPLKKYTPIIKSHSFISANWTLSGGAERRMRCHLVRDAFKNLRKNIKKMIPFANQTDLQRQITYVDNDFDFIRLSLFYSPIVTTKEIRNFFGSQIGKELLQEIEIRIMKNNSTQELFSEDEEIDQDDIVVAFDWTNEALRKKIAHGALGKKERDILPEEESESSEEEG